MPGAGVRFISFWFFEKTKKNFVFSHLCGFFNFLANRYTPLGGLRISMERPVYRLQLDRYSFGQVLSSLRAIACLFRSGGADYSREADPCSIVRIFFGGPSPIGEKTEREKN